MDYKKQAEDFLRDCNIVLKAIEAVPQKRPRWAEEGEEYGVHYSVTIAKAKLKDCALIEGNEDKKRSYTFDFWDSIHNKQKGRKPTVYDILACLDTSSEGYTFEDFCFNYGYDDDSRTAEKIYNSVAKQIDGLKRVFSSEELSILNEIH